MMAAAGRTLLRRVRTDRAGSAAAQARSCAALAGRRRVGGAAGRSGGRATSRRAGTRPVSRQARRASSASSGRPRLDVAGDVDSPRPHRRAPLAGRRPRKVGRRSAATRQLLRTAMRRRRRSLRRRRSVVSVHGRWRAAASPMKTVRPGSLDAVMRPPWRSTIALTMDSPSPLPVWPLLAGIRDGSAL